MTVEQAHNQPYTLYQEEHMHITTQEQAFEELPLEEMALENLGIEELESRVQLSGTTLAASEVAVEVSVSW